VLTINYFVKVSLLLVLPSSLIFSLFLSSLTLSQNPAYTPRFHSAHNICASRLQRKRPDFRFEFLTTLITEVLSSEIKHHAVRQKQTYISKEQDTFCMLLSCLAFYFPLKTEGIYFCELPVDFQWTTGHYIPEHITLRKPKDI
jgi:hypothetical protein